jgi:hypothetical protein
VRWHDDEMVDSDVVCVTEEITAQLGPQSAWPSPVRLESVAQCVLNSLYSTGNRSEAVVRVLNRYRQRRSDAGADPYRDGPADLLSEIESCGGPEGFADALNNHWRAWRRTTAPYKTQVIYEAAQLLVAASVRDRSDLEAALRDEAVHQQLKKGWLSLPGQRSGLTWRFFLMNTGMPGIKADRMITRWTSEAIGREVTPPEAERILNAAATQLSVDSRLLDHAIWHYERRRPDRRHQR